MRAVVIDNGQLGVAETEDPRPAGDEVVVQIAAAGLNPADLQQLRGRYPSPPGWPAQIPGMELAGTITKLGAKVSGLSVGDRVMALVGAGAHAERLALPASSLIAIPDGIDFETAAGFPEAFCTAWDALITQGQLIAGERVLITGATGGVGAAAVQIARLAGARVTASVRNPATAAEHLAGLDPDARLVTPDEVTGPFDVVLELVGGQQAFDRVGQLAIGGRIVVIGVGAGAQGTVNLGALMRVRGTIRASTLRARPQWEKAVLIQKVAHHLLPALADGMISVPIDSIFPLAEAAEAYDRLGSSGKFGKVILRMS